MIVEGIAELSDVIKKLRASKRAKAEAPKVTIITPDEFAERVAAFLD